MLPFLLFIFPSGNLRLCQSHFFKIEHLVCKEHLVLLKDAGLTSLVNEALSLFSEGKKALRLKVIK